jgi:hypothetical protein
LIVRISRSAKPFSSGLPTAAIPSAARLSAVRQVDASPQADQVNSFDLLQARQPTPMVQCGQ